MNIKELRKRGIDVDLYRCLYHNPQSCFTVTDIERVLAVWEGENEGDHWRWIIRLVDKRMIYLDGWCDYTGWDCQSEAWHFATTTLEQAVRLASYPPNIPDENYEVEVALKKQLAEGKRQVWTEEKDKEFELIEGYLEED